MTTPIRPKRQVIQTVLSGPKELVCPICGSHEFLAFAPDIERAKAEGFRHVVMGLYGEKELHALPVRFWHCANCGFILNFMIGQFKKGDRDDQL
jgi:rubrerythrin